MSETLGLPPCEKNGIAGTPCYPVQHTIHSAPNGTRYAKCRACKKPFLYTLVHEKIVKGLPHVPETPPNPDFPPIP